MDDGNSDQTHQKRGMHAPHNDNNHICEQRFILLYVYAMWKNIAQTFSRMREKL